VFTYRAGGIYYWLLVMAYWAVDEPGEAGLSTPKTNGRRAEMARSAMAINQ
jgi:hypothetical protein